jgi:hypothetical protein
LIDDEFRDIYGLEKTGVDYETGEFENQIPGSIVSGDLTNDNEWIFVPADTPVRYYVSSHDTEAFLEANPDIADQLTEEEKTESYEIYAEYIDPESGFYQSETLTEEILPGQEKTHEISGDLQSPVISEGITEETPELPCRPKHSP